MLRVDQGSRTRRSHEPNKKQANGTAALYKLAGLYNWYWSLDQFNGCLPYVCTIHVGNFQCSVAQLPSGLSAYETEVRPKYPSWCYCGSDATLYWYICLNWRLARPNHFTSISLHFFLVVSSFLRNLVRTQGRLQKGWLCHDFQHGPRGR